MPARTRRADLDAAQPAGAPREAAGPASFVWLASQSPRRAQLLDQLGIAHRPLLPDEAEDAEALEHPLPGEAPAAYVQRVTQLKLQAALARRRLRGLEDAPVLCADTTVALGRRMLAKPADATEARAMLASLSGHRHRVLTAVAVGQGRRMRAALSVSWVEVEPLTSAQIERYVRTGEPMGKAGAYAIQGRFAAHVRRIRGSHSGIMGLPLHETALLLQAFRCLPPA